MNKVKNWFKPPVFENDEEKTRSARLLNYILWAVFALTGYYLVTAPFTHADPTPLVVSSIILLVLLTLGLAVNKKGFVHQTASVFVTFFWVFFTIRA